MPWTGFDLINAVNAWKKTEDAGRVFTVDAAGGTEPVVTGLGWRTKVCQQVFEETGVDRDLNTAVNLARWGQSQHDIDPRTPTQGAPPACGGHPSRAGETLLVDAGTDVHTAPAS